MRWRRLTWYDSKLVCVISPMDFFSYLGQNAGSHYPSSIMLQVRKVWKAIPSSFAASPVHLWWLWWFKLSVRTVKKRATQSFKWFYITVICIYIYICIHHTIRDIHFIYIYIYLFIPCMCKNIHICRAIHTTHNIRYVIYI